MSEYTMGAIEMRFAEIIWEHEPVSSGELVKLCEQELNWIHNLYSPAAPLPEGDFYQRERNRNFVTVEADVSGETE